MTCDTALGINISPPPLPHPRSSCIRPCLHFPISSIFPRLLCPVLRLRTRISTLPRYRYYGRETSIRTIIINNFSYRYNARLFLFFNRNNLKFWRSVFLYSTSSFSTLFPLFPPRPSREVRVHRDGVTSKDQNTIHHV